MRNQDNQPEVTITKDQLKKAMFEIVYKDHPIASHIVHGMHTRMWRMFEESQVDNTQPRG